MLMHNLNTSFHFHGRVLLHYWVAWDFKYLLEDASYIYHNTVKVY
jgi:hypothetical protein